MDVEGVCPFRMIELGSECGMTTVATVNGEISFEEFGMTLPHEHLFINLLRERRGDGLVHDERAIIQEVEHFRAQGGATMFDLTTAELTAGSTVNSTATLETSRHQTRDPHNVEAIQRVAAATGLNVVLGTGRYRDPFLDADLIEELGPAGLGEEMVRDLLEGIPGTTARAGLIGEIGSDKWYISALEHTVFTAAARAHQRTNAAVYTHAARWPVAVDQIALLREEGVAPSKIAVGHVDTVPVDGFAVEVAKHGVYVGIDTINSTNAHEVNHRVDAVMELVRAGYLDRILLSHDVCLLSQLRLYGGNGYGFVMGEFKEALLRAGLNEGEFDEITRKNPARLVV